MKRLITIIIALVMTLFSVPDQGADQPPVIVVKTPQTAITVQVEQVPETSETTEVTAFVGEVSKTETAVEIKETTANENEVVTEEHEVFTEEKIVECIDEGDQSLVKYKPQIGGQPNPFENDTPTEIDDRSAEDYIGEGEDRPGEGKHF